MSQHERKRQEKSYTIHPVWKWVLFAAVVIYCGITILTQQVKINEQKAMTEELSAREQELEERIETLESELAYMDTDEYVERTARDRLGMVKEDEIIFREEEKES